MVILKFLRKIVDKIPLNPAELWEYFFTYNQETDKNEFYLISLFSEILIRKDKFNTLKSFEFLMETGVKILLLQNEQVQQFYANESSFPIEIAEKIAEFFLVLPTKIDLDYNLFYPEFQFSITFQIENQNAEHNSSENHMTQICKFNLFLQFINSIIKFSDNKRFIDKLIKSIFNKFLVPFIQPEILNHKKELNSARTALQYLTLMLEKINRTEFAKSIYYFIFGIPELSQRINLLKKTSDSSVDSAQNSQEKKSSGNSEKASHKRKTVIETPGTMCSVTHYKKKHGSILWTENNEFYYDPLSPKKEYSPIINEKKEKVIIYVGEENDDLLISPEIIMQEFSKNKHNSKGIIDFILSNLTNNEDFCSICILQFIDKLLSFSEINEFPRSLLNSLLSRDFNKTQENLKLENISNLLNHLKVLFHTHTKSLNEQKLINFNSLTRLMNDSISDKKIKEEKTKTKKSNRFPILKKLMEIRKYNKGNATKPYRKISHDSFGKAVNNDNYYTPLISSKSSLKTISEFEDKNVFFLLVIYPKIVFSYI